MVSSGVHVSCAHATIHFVRTRRVFRVFRARAQTMELSEEERAMAGAPQGELYVATIYKREEVTACDDTEAALKDLLGKVCVWSSPAKSMHVP